MTARPDGSSTSSPSCMTTRPRTMVPTARPVTSTPLNGVTLFFEWSFSSSIVHVWSRSTIVRSPSEPSCERALLRVHAPDLGRTLRGHADELLERHVDRVAPPCDRKTARLVSTLVKPEIAFQMSSFSFSSRVCGEWSVPIASMRPVEKPLEERLAVLGRADGRVHPQHRAEPRHVDVGVQEAVVLAGLGRDVDALPAPLLDHLEPVARAQVEDVDLRARVAREERHALDRLDLADRRPRVDVGERVGAAGGLRLRGSGAA